MINEQPAELIIGIEIKRANGDVEHYELIGTALPIPQPEPIED